jgi:hypothetical protein
MPCYSHGDQHRLRQGSGQSNFITNMLTSLVNEYSANQEFDVDWSMDWSMPDDHNTRGDDNWVILAGR